jgi:acyl carrier protein
MSMSTPTTDVRAALADIVRNDLAVNLPVIDASSLLVADLGLDSVAFAVALLAIEERMGVQVSQRDLLECQTFGDVERLVQGHLVDAASNDKAAR